MARNRSAAKTPRKGGWDPSSWVSISPNGIGHQKPNHYGEMVRTVWDSRRRLPFARRILTQGTCDGCALGTAGLHDWTIDGVHLCTIRLNLLKLNTMGPLDPSVLASTGALEKLSSKELRDLGRLPYPMRMGAGERGFTRVSWDDALDEIATAIRAAGGDRCGLYLTSRGITNEVYYSAQKAWRSIGSAHVDNAARVCHSPSTAALKGSIGVGATTCSYKDLFEADLIVFFGSDAANNQPVLMKYLYLAKRNNGTRIAMVNPFREPGMERYWVPSNAESALFGTKFCDDFFQVTTGGDMAFIMGVLKVLFAAGMIDNEFIASRTTGVEELRAQVEDFTWEEVENRSGLTRADCERFANIYGQAKRVILVWSMGITQHTFGTDNVRAIVNLGLARGMVGRDGCGLMPIRGHSGVQGGAEMGAYATALPGGIPIDEEAATSLGERYGFEVPSHPGMGAVEMLEAADKGELDVLYSSGGNFLEVLPAPDRVRESLSHAKLRVHQDIVVTSQMLVPAEQAVILLPAATRYEQEGGGTETTTERRIVFSPEIKGRRIGEAQSEWKIFSDLAERVRGDRLGSFDSAQAIRNEISEVVPAYSGIERLSATGDAVQWGGRHLCEESFPTPDGKARFSIVDPPETVLPSSKFKLSTRRGKQFNSMVHKAKDPLTGANRDAVFMSEQDATELGLRDGDAIKLRSDEGEFNGHVRISRIAPRNLAVHWPEANVLISPGAVDHGGGVPDYNAVVEVEKA